VIQARESGASAAISRAPRLKQGASPGNWPFEGACDPTGGGALAQSCPCPSGGAASERRALACCLRRRRFSRSAAARRSPARGSDLRAPAGAGLAGDGASSRLASSCGALMCGLLSFMGSPAGPGGSGLVDRGDRPGGKALSSGAMAMEARWLRGNRAIDPAPQTLFHPSWLATRQSLWHKPGVARALARVWPCCGSSVVEHSIGNGEVESSILSRSTSYSNEINVLVRLSPVRSRIFAHPVALVRPAQSPLSVKQQASCGERFLGESGAKTTQFSQAQALDMEKFGAAPISSSIARVTQVTASAILYKRQASTFWRFPLFLDESEYLVMSG